MEELKADLVSIFAVQTLVQQGYYDAMQARSHYASGVAGMFEAGLAARDPVYRTMRLMQWNFFMQNGVLAFEPGTGTLTIRYENFHPAIGKLLEQVLELQNAGDKPAAERLHCPIHHLERRLARRDHPQNRRVRSVRAHIV